MIKNILGIILISILILGLLSSCTSTWAVFKDSEYTDENSFTGWNSLLWEQTTQSDFTNGLLNQVDINSRDGYIQLSSTGSLDDWYDLSWSYRKSITIDHSKVISDMTDFPVLINLASDSDLQTYAQSNGNDILFTSSNGLTKLNYEIERYVSSTGQLVAWIKFPTISSSTDTIIYMYYGNPSATNQQSPESVWTNNYLGVWHLNDTSDINVNDSSSNGLDGNSNSGVMLNATGKMDGAMSFNGTNGSVNLGTGTQLNFTASTPFTIEGWYSTTDPYGPLISFRNSSTSSGGDNAVIDICVGDDGSTINFGKLMALVRDNNSGSGYARVTGPTVNNGSWRYFVLTRNSGNQIQLFSDGISAGTDAEPNSGGPITTNIRAIANEIRWVQDNFRDGPDNRWLSGTVDEVKISSTQRSNGWITTSYNNQNSPGTFYTLGSIENPPSSSSANLILFWDGSGSVPAGWTDVSASGQDFYQRFPLGAASYGGKGGSEANHTHTASFISMSSGSNTTRIRTSGSNRASVSHTHTVTSVTVGQASNLPAYRDLRVIKYNNGIPSNIPAGIIAIFDTNDLPTNWTEISSSGGNFYDVYPRGNFSSGTATVDNSKHTVNNTLSNSTGTRSVTTTGGTTTSVAAAAHNHTGSGTTTSYDPPYVSVVLARADVDTPLPCGTNGLIAMFDDTPSTNSWDLLSATGGEFNSRFIKGSDSYGSKGGSLTHSHPNLTITTGTGTTAIGRTGTSDYVSSSNHTHDVTYSFSNTTVPFPPYINVIFAKAVHLISTHYVDSGAFDSMVLDTNLNSSHWNALFWDMDNPSNTNISIEVRASNNSFDIAEDESVLPWNSVLGNSPKLIDLPQGRYKQWRVILSTDDNTETPALDGVRLYYYR
jgi:hypothetical protein